MRQFNKFKDTKGFITIWERVLRFRYMITEQAKERCRILAFWERYGDLATKEAFKVSRPTLYRWQGALLRGDGKLEALNKKSTAPKNKRKQIIPEVVQNFILTERKFDPHLSKDKPSILMKEDKVADLSSSTYPHTPKMNSEIERFNRTAKKSHMLWTNTAPFLISLEGYN